jgi:hypothetical protein
MIKTAIHHKISAYGKTVRRMGKDRRLMATHISLFTALFVQWQRNDFISPFPVTRKELIKSASGNWTNMVISIITHLITR